MGLVSYLADDKLSASCHRAWLQYGVLVYFIGSSVVEGDLCIVTCIARSEVYPAFFEIKQYVWR